MVMYLACDTFMENHLTTLDWCQKIKVTVAAYLYMYRLCDTKMCSQTKFGIPRIYARDTIFLDLIAMVKMRDSPWPVMH